MSNNPAFGISLAELFAKRIFRIPDYQRGYAWGERQLMELWQDIEHWFGVSVVDDLMF